MLTAVLRTDWVQDTAREQARRNARRRRAAGVRELGSPGWRYRLWESYDAAQGWIVVTLVGAAIGFNAALLSIITEWLSDIKLGYCTTGFYLNENFCCWGEDSGECAPCGIDETDAEMLNNRLFGVASLDGL